MRHAGGHPAQEPINLPCTTPFLKQENNSCIQVTLCCIQVNICAIQVNTCVIQVNTNCAAHCGLKVPCCPREAHRHDLRQLGPQAHWDVDGCLTSALPLQLLSDRPQNCCIKIRPPRLRVAEVVVRNCRRPRRLRRCGFHRTHPDRPPPPRFLHRVNGTDRPSHLHRHMPRRDVPRQCRQSLIRRHVLLDLGYDW